MLIFHFPTCAACLFYLIIPDLITLTVSTGWYEYKYFISEQRCCTFALRFQMHDTCLPSAFCFSWVCMRMLALCHRNLFLCKFMYGKVPRPHIRYMSVSNCAMELFITLWVCSMLITGITIHTIHWHWDLYSNVCVLKGHAEFRCYGDTSRIVLYCTDILTSPLDGFHC